MGAEDGTVWQYEIESGKMEKLLVRCALPVRDIGISKDAEWAAIASELVCDQPELRWVKRNTDGELT